MRRQILLGLVGFLTILSPCEGSDDLPSRQDVQIMGRVLKFQEDRKGDTRKIALIYNPASPTSYREAATLNTFLGSGQAIGSLTLSGVLIEQDKAGALEGYDAIFSAVETDSGRLRSAMRRHEVPCITREVDQVSQGACIVAIQTSPNTAIFFSSTNAAAAGVRFATAFIMMVREL
jgi:hypothetical protein